MAKPSLGGLKMNDLFRFPGKKAIYRVVQSGNLFIQYENIKRQHSLHEVGSLQKAYDKEVEVIATLKK